MLSKSIGFLFELASVYHRLSASAMSRTFERPAIVKI
jgi:hypothetical protein